jgi:hypothetical protein
MGIAVQASDCMSACRLEDFLWIVVFVTLWKQGQSRRGVNQAQTAHSLDVAGL